MKLAYRLRLRDEIHAQVMLGRAKGEYSHIPKGQRLAVIRAAAKQIGTMPDFNIINIVVDKSNKPVGYEVFEMAWKALIQRFENTINHRNFRGPQNADERGILFPDHTADKKLTRLLRSMRRWNPIPNQAHLGHGYRNMALTRMVEDPNFRVSSDSYFIQTCDVASYLLKQWLEPSSYMKHKGGKNYFQLIAPALCTVAATNDPHGIVRL